MLRSLAIRDIVVFDRLSLDLAGAHGIRGLCALTGETGAGKSILLDSLGLALGQRAESRLVRNGADRGAVTAVFELPANHPVRQLLAENDIPDEADLILRRSVSADGRSRAWINDQPVSVSLLSAVGAALVEIHGQAAEIGLLDPTSHRRILDAFGGLEGRVETAAAMYRDWRAAEKALRQAERRIAKAQEDEEFLRHAVAELEALAPETGEVEVLAERRGLLMQVEKIATAVSDATSALEQDGGVAGRLRAAERALDRVRDLAGSRIEAAMDALARAGVELDEAVNAILAVSSDLEAEGEDLESVDDRLFALRAAARKHGIEPDDLPGLLDRFSEQLREIDSGAESIAGLEAEAERLGAAWRQAARELTDARRQAAEHLDAAVKAELEPLRMGGARFVTDVRELERDQWSAEGADRVAFLVATNPGSVPGPIGKIASGGELSRFMLALKVVLAGTGDAPTMIFDEVDRGVGGATADAVGERLKRLSDRFQVLVVTHSPQVAARADRQWRIAKKVGETAVTEVVPLHGDDRLEEVARMLSGAEVTDEARAAAARLMGTA